MSSVTWIVVVSWCGAIEGDGELNTNLEIIGDFEDKFPIFWPEFHAVPRLATEQILQNGVSATSW